MLNTLKIQDRIVDANNIISLLDNYRILPQLVRELVIDRALEDIEYTDTEVTAAYQNFQTQYQLDSEAEITAWLSKMAMNQAQLQAQMIRKIKLKKFKYQQFNHQIESYFLERKLALEKAIFSLIRVKSPGIAKELYHRLQEAENSFAELAQAYSLGREAGNNGIVGTVRLIDVHPLLAQILHQSQLGKLLPPQQIEDHWVIVRVEKYFPAKLDCDLREKLLDELFTNWLQKQLSTIDLHQIQAA